jgi:predicted dehydrogenase
MVDKARIGIIGTGWWATTAHFPSLKAHPKAELVAAADVRPDILGKAAQKYGVANTYTDYRQMLDKEDLDGVVVAVWHAEHFEVARTCLENGLHVMLEKPMVLRAVHARELVDVATKNGRELIIGYPWHFTPHTLRAREVVQSGELGRVLFVNSIFASAVLQFLRGEDKTYEAVFGYPVVGPGDVYADIEKSGGGQGHLQVTHSAALTLFITGLKPVSTMAMMENLDVHTDVVDAMAVRLDNGALATVGSIGTVRPGDGDILTTQIVCEDGQVTLDSIGGTGSIRHKDQSLETFEPLAAEAIYPMQVTAANLVDVINGDAANGSPAEVGWRVVELLDSAYRSVADGGRQVKVEELYD